MYNPPEPIISVDIQEGTSLLRGHRRDLVADDPRRIHQLGDVAGYQAPPFGCLERHAQHGENHRHATR
jgi:hypothetical protein